MTAKIDALAPARKALLEGRLAEAERLLLLQPHAIRSKAAFVALMAELLVRTGRVQSAVELLREALSSAEHPEILNLLSVASRTSGDLVTAKSAAARAIELAPKEGIGHSNLGLASLLQGDAAAAVTSLGKAVELQPDSAPFRHNLGLGLQTAGRDAEAAAQFRAAISLMEPGLPSRLALGGLMLKYGNPNGALECASRVLEFDSSNSSARLLAARALVNLGEESRAEEYLRALLELSPNDSVALSMLGFRLQAAGDFAAAQRAFAKSVEVNSLQGASYWGMVQGKTAGGGDPAWLDRLRKIAGEGDLEDQERAYLLFAIAKSFADLGDFANAMSYYDLANESAASAQFHAKAFDQDAYAKGIQLTTEIFSRDFLDKNRSLGSETRRPIFIVGMMRSGTTLLEQILSSHPLVGAGGELRYWLDRGPRVVDPNKRQIDAGQARALVEEYLSLLDRLSAGNPHVTDKMPENSQMLGLINILLPKAKIVHMNRNPLDVCLSIYMTPYEISPVFAHNKKNIVFAYRMHEQLMAHWRSVLPSDSLLEVSYDDLVGDGEAKIREVLDFLGLPWSDDCLRHSSNTRSVNTPSVWQVRQPLYKTSSGRWRQYEGHLGAFAELCSLLPGS